MELTEKTLESREIFRGRIVTLKVDKIELPDGHQSGREVVALRASSSSNAP